MKNKIKTKAIKGFSLVELLVVIAVIGVIAAIAIPAMSGIFGKSESAKARRNGQAIVSTFNSARAAGNTASYANVGAAITAVTSTTGLAGAGAFTGSQFSAPMSSTESSAASTGIALSATDGNGVMTLTAQ
ncbi:MAG: type II secretion system protein [Verrucomicrobiota bacterium]